MRTRKVNRITGANKNYAKWFVEKKRWSRTGTIGPRTTHSITNRTKSSSEFQTEFLTVFRNDFPKSSIKHCCWWCKLGFALMFWWFLGECRSGLCWSPSRSNARTNAAAIFEIFNTKPPSPLTTNQPSKPSSSSSQTTEYSGPCYLVCALRGFPKQKL